MRNVFLIVGRELNAYLRTPSGYIIAASVLLVDGLLFNALAVGDEPRYSADVLQIFFANAAAMVMVAAVLFSMRFLAEERSRGTQVLLMTSPIREGEIVLGKFLASLVFLSVLIVLSLYLPALIFVNGKVSVGHIAAGYIGMILLGATTLAIGLFASSLVRNPFLGVLLAAVFVTLLELSWFVGSIADPPLTDLLAYLAPYRKHFRPFQKGLVQLSDIVFYFSVTYFFLFASTRALQSQRWQ